MKIFRDITEIRRDKKTALTIGTFDGVHLGHRRLLDSLMGKSRENNLRNIVITFDPHPRIVLSSDNGIKLLNTLNEKLEAFEKLGIENVLVIKFTEEFSKQRSEEFLKSYIIDKIGVSEFIIGYDHKFGRNRDGDQNLLSRLSRKYDFSLSVVDGVSVNGNPVSSTSIRNQLLDGNVKSANHLLGRKYYLSGKVIKGAMRGRELGFPTANLKVTESNKLIPAQGVYAVESIVGNKNYNGIMNIGLRPTFEERIEPVIEVHIFDFNSDIYSNEIKIGFIDRIRDEKQFNSKDELIEQIKMDIEKAYSLIGNLVN
jgi:riboflavin kinase/FMN adenylyltransferase